MKQLLVSSVLLVASLLTACSTQEVEDVGTRIQKVRLHNALSAKNAQIRVWKDTSTYDQQGWHLHSDQENRFTMPESEFKTARGLVIAHGSTWQRQNAPVSTTQTDTAPAQFVELEWMNADGQTIGGIDLLRVRKESQLDNSVTSDFPFVLPDEIYDQFMAIPTINSALEVVRK